MLLLSNRMTGFGGRRARIVTDGLRVHFAAQSYASGQNWDDSGPDGNSLWRGSTSGADADDPTFNAGSPAYWSFDGADQFTARVSGAGTLIRQVGRQDAPFSLECWIQPAAGGSALQAVFSNSRVSGSAGLTFYSSGTTTNKPRVNFQGSDLSLDATSALGEGVWQHIGFAGRGDGSTCTFYLNGAADGTGTANNSSWTSGDSLNGPELGYAGGTTYLDSGTRLAILRLYNRVLGAAEMLQNFNAERARFGL